MYVIYLRSAVQLRNCGNNSKVNLPLVRPILRPITFNLRKQLYTTVSEDILKIESRFEPMTNVA